MGWVAPADYMAASVDPLAETAADLIREMNTAQQETLLLLARECGKLDAEQASITTMDRLGFHLRVKTPDRMQGGRFAFTAPVHNEQQARAGLADLAAKARAGVELVHSL